VLAPGSCIVRPISRAGVPTSSAAFGHGAKVGHALFHAMVLEHGSRPQQHVGESVARLRAMGTMDATRALLKSAPAGGFDTRRRELPLFGTNELRQPPLNWYSAAR
jgi:hypothetical protein